jgi:hypothetical protein
LVRAISKSLNNHVLDVLRWVPDEDRKHLRGSLSNLEASVRKATPAETGRP